MSDEFPVKADFLELAVSALTKRVEQIFGFGCNFVLGDYDRRAVSKIDGEIKYPYALLRLNSVERRTEGMNPTAMRRFGFRTIIEESGQNWLKFHGVPVTCDLSLRMVFGDSQDLFQAIHNYFLKQNHFSFVLEAAEGSFNIEHTVQYDPNFTVPAYEESEYGLNMPFESNLRMGTWIGEIHSIPIVVTSKVNVSRHTEDEILELESQGVRISSTDFIERSNLTVNPRLPVSQGSQSN